MEKYTTSARWYDLISAEPVYRAGRQVAIPAMGLRPGDRVLDVGCGTGLNLPGLAAAVGADGLVLGLDRSGDMLDVARGKAERRGLGQAAFLEVDVMRLSRADLARSGSGTSAASERGFDGAIFTYALSLMPDPTEAWRRVRGLLREGAAVAVVDMQPPTGLATLTSPLAHLACRLGGADIHARPWEAVERDLTGVRAWSRRGGHVQVRVGALARRD
ncbi:class I SAM-dependent methyltransferase [Nocardioides sp. GCM10027113]|uniref:class I SAM-dependent methyltransferase n=1 Tax=unclassified Nocardioides TaxID=2615069 RepID=UPI00361EE2E1